MMNDDGHESIIICPCGLRFTGTPKEAQRMYRAHRCGLHEPDGSDWPGAFAFIALLLLISFLCTRGWGLVK